MAATDETTPPMTDIQPFHAVVGQIASTQTKLVRTEEASRVRCGSSSSWFPQSTCLFIRAIWITVTWTSENLREPAMIVSYLPEI